MTVSGIDGHLLSTSEGIEQTGDPIDPVRAGDFDGIRAVVVGSIGQPSRMLSPREPKWFELPRRLYRARAIGDIDEDGTTDLIGPEVPYWAPTEVVVVSGADGQVRFRISTEPGYRFLSGWEGVGDQDGDGCPDFAVVSDDELPKSTWVMSDYWQPGFGAVTVYSGKDGSVLRRVDRDTLIGVARAGVDLWEIR